MISIIIPVYNAEDYLSECLESVRKQTYKDFEVICINDGSVDSSKEICESFASSDNRFLCITQRNQGVSAARNRGLDEARGDYVCFIDSDDVVDTLFLETLIKDSPGSDLVICDYTRKWSELGQGLGNNHLKKYTPNKLIYDVVFEQIKHPNIVCFFYNRAIIESNYIRFTVGCVRNEDYEFYMRYLVACINPVVVTDYIGYYYRQNNNSAMSKMTTKALTSLEATERIATLLEEKGIVKSKTIILANGVLSFLYRTAVSNSKELYDYVQSHYNARDSMLKMLSFPVLKKKLVAITYLLIGKKLFYKILSQKSK